MTWFSRPLITLATAAALLAAGTRLHADPDREKTLRLPESVRKGNASYVEEVPDADYRHASEAAYRSFRDMKYGVRIHWGLYSLLPHARESWTFLELPDEARQRWLESYRSWNPQGFDARAWMDFFKRAGFECFAITTKHHEGFSLWDTRTRVKQRPNFSVPGKPTIEDCDVAFSVMETPFKRDIIRELTDAARARDIKINLYFSHSDWYDVSFRPHGRHPIQNVSSTGIKSLEERQKRPAVLFPDPTPEEIQHLVTRHREQLRELMTRYGKIDMLCLDISLGESTWPQVKETIKEVRRLQPDVMIRNRGIGNYADYYTPERVVPGDKAATALPWMVIYPLGRNFSWEGEASQHKGAKWVVDNLVDSVAKGGNFMVGIGPNGNGTFHPEAIRQLEEVGAWLKINGEGIWGTHERPGDLWREGDGIRFTAANDGRHVYALLLSRPAGPVTLSTVSARPGSTLRLLGHSTPLSWSQTGGTLTIAYPSDATPALAYVLKIEVPR
ncbi:MAG: alpha-L-fucosidase [Opitutaceae bacterium]